MQQTVLRILLALLVMAGLVSCGQKGGLTRPDPATAYTATVR